MKRVCQLFSTCSHIINELELHLEGDNLDGDSAYEFQQTDSVETLLDALSQCANPTVFLDLRTECMSAQTEEFLQLLATGALTELNVVTVVENGYPLRWASLLESITLAFLRFPLRRAAVEELTEILDAAPYSRHPRRLPQAQKIVADDMAMTTFTESLFPVLSQIARVARHDVTLLIVGETGTGKTTLARLIHKLSSRREKKFHDIACGTLPPDLIESELFGHARGAFTGAERNKIGRFAAAGHGTLLLDEIDVLGKKEQAKLLKVIETGEFEVVGSTETQQSEARLIVASNVNLEQLTEKGEFRSDLYYRLNVLEFCLPSLRERPLDIVPLAVQFIEEISAENGIPVESVHLDFLEALKNYHWPGNLRELKNHMRRAVLFCDNGELTVNNLSHLVIKPQFESPATISPRDDSWTLAQKVANNEQEILEAALAENNDNRTATAKALGISRVGLYKKMKKYGMIEPKPTAKSGG